MKYFPSLPKYGNGTPVYKNMKSNFSNYRIQWKDTRVLLYILVYDIDLYMLKFNLDA